MKLITEMTSKLRQWDHRSSQWFTKNFSVLLFEVLLAFICFLLLNMMIDLFAIEGRVNKDNLTEQILLSQARLTQLIVMILIFNSFLMIYLFNNMIKIRGVLKNMDYNTSRRRNDSRDDEN